MNFVKLNRIACQMLVQGNNSTCSLLNGTKLGGSGMMEHNCIQFHFSKFDKQNHMKTFGPRAICNIFEHGKDLLASYIKLS